KAKTALPEMLALVKDEYFRVREWVLRGISKVAPSSAEVKAALRQGLKDDNEWVRLAAARVLRWDYDDDSREVIAELLRSLNHPAPFARREAMEALQRSNILPQESAEDVAETLKDPETRALGLQLLDGLRVRNDSVTAALMICLDDKRGEIVAEATLLLARF